MSHNVPDRSNTRLAGSSSNMMASCSRPSSVLSKHRLLVNRLLAAAPFPSSQPSSLFAIPDLILTSDGEDYRCKTNGLHKFNSSWCKCQLSAETKVKGYGRSIEMAGMAHEFQLLRWGKSFLSNTCKCAERRKGLIRGELERCEDLLQDLCDQGGLILKLEEKTVTVEEDPTGKPYTGMVPPRQRELRRAENESASRIYFMKSRCR